MSDFYLVRHGQACFGTDNYDRLSPLGHQQAIWLGEYFKQRDIHFDRVIVGDMVRHHETAQGICQGLGIDGKAPQFEVMPQLNEFDFLGLSRAYLINNPEQRPASKTDATAYFRLLKNSVAAWQHNDLSGPLHESWEEFKERVQQALEFIHHSSKNKSQRLLVVSSGGVKSVAMKHILDMHDDGIMRLNFQIKNSSISHFHCTRERILLTSFNQVPHLDSAQRRTSITYS